MHILDLTKEQFEVLSSLRNFDTITSFPDTVLPNNFISMHVTEKGDVFMKLAAVEKYPLLLHYTQKLKPLHYLFCDSCPYLLDPCEGSSKILERKCIKHPALAPTEIYAHTTAYEVDENSIAYCDIPEHVIYYHRYSNKFHMYGVLLGNYYPLTIGNADLNSGEICWGESSRTDNVLKYNLIKAYYKFMALTRNGDYLDGHETITIKNRLEVYSIEAYASQSFVRPHHVTENIHKAIKLEVDTYNYSVGYYPYQITLSRLMDYMSSEQVRECKTEINLGLLLKFKEIVESRWSSVSSDRIKTLFELALRTYFPGDNRTDIFTLLRFRK